MMLRFILFTYFICLTTQRLILPSQLPVIEEIQSVYLDPTLKTLDFPKDSGSSANPVQGIANATSGYLGVNDPKSNSKLFYIFHQCRGLTVKQTPKDVPIIIWLQGGPGDGAESGDFFAVGPYQLTYNSTTRKYSETPRKFSWNDHYNLLFIDSPRGSGYSIADNQSYVKGVDEVANDFLNALLNFYNLSNFETFQNTPLYIFGEAFAGRFIPTIAKRIFDYNGGAPKIRIPLSGLGIGNGYTYPFYQFGDNGVFGFNLGLIDDVQRAEIEGIQLQGIGSLLNGNFSDAQVQYDKLINLITEYGGGLNFYNYREFGNYDFSSLLSFMNDANTVRRYNVDPSVAGHYVDVNIPVFMNLINDIMGFPIDNLISVVNNGMPVLFFNGQDDLICNTPGVQNWIANLAWKEQNNFYNASFNTWVYQNGTIAGLQKNYKNFYFAIVNKAGHIAAMDQIETTTEMVRRFVNRQTNWTLPLSTMEFINI